MPTSQALEDKESVVDIKNTAAILGISPATVRNWVRCGYLQTSGQSTKYFFQLSEIEKFKLKISNGDFDKLNKRANKANADRTFIPEEYIEDKGACNELNIIVNFIKENNVDLSLALLLVALNLLKKERILSEVRIKDIIQKNDLSFSNKQIKKEIEFWLAEIEEEKIKCEFSFLLYCPVPKQRDTLGFIYQSFLLEGQKSQKGAYYTPSTIVNEIVSEYVKKDSKVFDPCCGTGQFLLAFAEVVENPVDIYGIDLDEVAVRIARLNILIKFKNKDFIPSITCKNTLFDVGSHDLFSLNDESLRDFDVIATNPPWGVHFSGGDIEKLKKFYPTITSFESFSYFLKKSLDLLRSDGVVSFILPESILNVKTHKDIRGDILKSSQIKKIVYLSRVFKNVFTSVIRLDLRKSEKNNGNVLICKEDERHNIKQARWSNNQDFIFDIHANGFDAEIIDKIHHTKYTTLENKASWALGIVTGDNGKFITNNQEKGFEPIYKGKDIEKFVLEAPSNYIHFAPEKFQQIAPTEKYRAKEKLIYRFISKYLVFAYDDKQRLTLNSANIVIPKISDYPIKVIAALFNSSLYQLIFQKKFSSIKILRSHIEQLPLPLWDRKTFSEIIELVDKTIKDKNRFEELDNYIMEKYALSAKEKNYIIEFNR